MKFNPLFVQFFRISVFFSIGGTTTLSYREEPKIEATRNVTVQRAVNGTVRPDPEVVVEFVVELKASAAGPTPRAYAMTWAMTVCS